MQADKLRNLPDLPGVYLFKNQNNQIIYIGKANSLAKRIKNYTYKNNDLKKSKLLEKIQSLEYIVTDSPIEALILELNLIKKYHPYFNIRLKDDKSFPYIEITQNELYPRICITRKLHKEIKSYLFGPYTNSKALKTTLNLIKNIFKIRTCKFNLPKKNIKACLDYQLNLCSAPCILKIDPIMYKELVKKTINFLEGRTDKIIEELNLQIDSESKKLNFEKCQIFLNMLRALKQVALKQKIIFKQNIDADFIFLKLRGAMTSIAILQLREGKLIGEQKFILENFHTFEDISEDFLNFLAQYYRETYIPKEIYLNLKLKEKYLLINWLKNIKKEEVKLFFPKRGKKYELLSLAGKNAEIFLENCFKKEKQDKKSLRDLKDLLKLKSLPKRIESIDISNLSGKKAVGAIIVFQDGKPLKQEYRKFKIKTLDTPNDYLMLEEVLKRRIKIWKVNPPSILLIDGGKGHLNIARKLFEKENIKLLPLALAKENEFLFIPNKSKPIKLKNFPMVFNLLIHLRDEAHRFALKYHQKLRKLKFDRLK